MAKRITVVVSQGQSNNPAKRDLEESIVAALLMEPGVEAVVVPNLYDLTPDGTGILALQGIPGDMVVLSWLFDRAAHWTLDRNGIRGLVGTTLLKSPSDEDEDEDDGEVSAEGGDDEADGDGNGDGKKHRVVDDRPLPQRRIYCLDLRIYNTPDPYLEEIRRIAAELSTAVVGLTDWVQGSPPPNQMARFLKPTNNTSLGPATADGNGASSKAAGIEPSASASQKDVEKGTGTLCSADTANVNPPVSASQSEPVPSSDATPSVRRVEDEADRRWYPVIDYSRCTNCMECIDFCLFGVYGVDRVETILVEQPDNCRKGCPACSRVCPENAIIFPQHKTPAIAGSAESAASMKIDLSLLFGAPETNESAEEAAARERDEQLVLAGRDPVGMSVGMPKRQERGESKQRDELDDLIDELDNLDV